MRRKDLKVYLLVILAYGLLAVAMTWPLVAQLDSHIPGDVEREDHLTHQWTFWWIKRAVGEGQNPLYTNLMFYPDGISLTSHNIAWLNILFWLPLQAIFGQTAAYNLVYLGIFVLNAFAVFLLARDIIESLPAAFVSGVVFGFWPYTISHYDHPNLILVGWIPLALLYLRRTMAGQRIGDMLLTVFFVVLTGITRWQLLIIAAFVLGFYVIWRLVTDVDSRSRLNLVRLGQIAILSFILLLPLALPLIAEQWLTGDSEALLYEHSTEGQTDLLAYFLPSRYHPLWGDRILTSEVFRSFIYNRLYIPFLGYTTLVLALVGVLAYKRRAAFWGVLALLLFLLALGPVLRIQGQLYPQIPLPYRLIEDNYFIRLLRRPDRFNIILGLPLGILAGLGVAAIRLRLSARWLANGATALLVGLILFEATPFPLPMISTLITPAWYEQLADEPGQFAIVDVPLRRVPYKYYMFYQTTHGKPTVQGRISRVPSGVHAFMDSIPMLAALRETQEMDANIGDVSEQLQQLDAADVRYMVVHKRWLPEGDLPEWKNWFIVDPLYEDEDIVVYRTDPQYGRDFVFDQVITSEVGLVSTTLGVESVSPGDTLPVQIAWGTQAPPPADYQVCFALVSEAGDRSGALCQVPAPDWPTSQWGTNALYRGRYDLFVPASLPTGKYRTLMWLTDSTPDQMVGEPVDLGVVMVTG